MHPAQQISQVFLEILLEIVGGGRLEHLLISTSMLLGQILFDHNYEGAQGNLNLIHQIVASQQHYDNIESQEALDLITRLQTHLLHNLPYSFILVDLNLLKIEYGSENARSEILDAMDNLQFALTRKLEAHYTYGDLQEKINNVQNKIYEHVPQIERQPALKSLANLQSSYLNIQSPPKIKHTY